jgi:malate dehydrogenase
MKTRKIALIGAGQIGGHLGNLLATRACGDVVLTETKALEGVARGKALDISQACALTGSDVRVHGSSNFSDIADADICIVSAGHPRHPGMTRLDLIKQNIPIMRDIGEKIASYAPQSLIIVVTNPLDLCTYVMKQASAFPGHRVVGMAGTLDSARLSAFLAQAVGCSVKDVNAMVLGSHGDLMVPILSYSSVNGIPVRKLLDASTLDRIVAHTRKAGGEIVDMMGTSAYFCAGEGIFDIAQSYLQDQKRLIPCSAYLQGEYGYEDIFMGVPVIIGSKGVERIIELELQANEMELLQENARHLQSLIEQLDNPRQ